MTSMLLVRRTRHTLRRAEFGFFGVTVYTRKHTPRFCGHERSAGDAVRVTSASRPCRMSCWIVGINRAGVLWGTGRVTGEARESSKKQEARTLAGARLLASIIRGRSQIDPKGTECTHKAVFLLI